MKGINVKHGLVDHPLYGVHNSIIKRCYNPNCKSFKNYGGRGILVCDEWRYNFESFYLWATENGWEPGLEVDRIHNDGNYSPENCRFVSRSVNTRNTRRNRVVFYKGENKTLIEWVEITGIKYSVALRRLIRGWSPEKTFETPVFVRGIPTSEEYHANPSKWSLAALAV
jgi:hypothetical protein